jgi:hypothetical protein
MIFGKKPVKTEVSKPQTADLEIVRPIKASPLPVMAKAKDVAPSTFPGFNAEEVEEEVVEEAPYVAPVKPVVRKAVPQPVVEEEPEQEAEPVVPTLKTKPFAQILSGEVLENGLHRYIVLSNKSIGKVGEILDVD